jgi:lipopolysaccharide/colanic/teichoic acid biosynthesis glycosyltransferase
MTIVNKKEPLFLALVDLLILLGSLYLTLALRYHTIPSNYLLNAHELPFLIIFVYSIVVFYISGLYGRTIFLSRSSIPAIVIRSQIINGLIAVALFYFIPSFGVSPKVTLFGYILLSGAVLIVWKMSAYSLFSLRHKYPALVIGGGAEVEELISEMNMNPRIGLSCRKRIDPDISVGELLSTMTDNGSTFQYIIADINDPRVSALLPELYAHFFPKTQVINIHTLYEETFHRIPLSCMNYAWIMSNISPISPRLYDGVKRVLDICFGIVITGATCIVYPCVALAIKLEDRGIIFIRQERTGKGGGSMHYYKFRSMQKNDIGKWVAESAQSENKITRIGMFIRKTRIDELPQGLAVLKGDMSLIGPRSDLAGLSERLHHEIPYYSVRTIVKPGLTGWAQVNQSKPPQSVEETKVRLSYDLYYIKYRSLSLDLQIVLKTFKTLLSREGM